MTPVLQNTLPLPLWGDGMNSRLPGVQPLAPDDWLWVDDAFAGQMALRDRLIAKRHGDVLALHADAGSAAREALETLISVLHAGPGYEVSNASVKRPDGVGIMLDWDDPLATAGRLVQEDPCLVQKIGEDHVLTGACLCFPAGWTLQEKMMRPLAAVHGPVAQYSADMSRRVNRLFDGIRAGRPLWRANGFLYDDPMLYAPFREASPRPKASDNAGYFRSERQCLLRLVQTRAVVFSIHTFVVERQNLTPQQQRCFAAHVG